MATDNKLLSFILEDGAAQAKEICREAEIKRDEILENASLKAEENAKEIENAAEKKAQSLNNIASSNASLVARNMVLKAKREEIDRTIDGMKEYILSLDEDRYFDILYRMAKSVSFENGEILLNKKDLERLPSDFGKKMEEAGIKADVSKAPADIAGGFILRNNMIEINCSIDSVIEDRRNEIEDFINESIFN
ncbi:MAG: V-type ATP synthase subunit E [Clostridiales bacterium]|nr:V-type ATP synthase subunit E [Clostridia bacterium]MCR4563525.1 V-type ATP synthase subunit E [Clostridiales bacterium]